MTISGYRDLAAHLRVAIQDGTYPPDTTLPKQADLAAEYEVNIKTVRQAVGLLEAEGLVTPVRRRGTVVRTRPPIQYLGIGRYSKRRWKFGDTTADHDQSAAVQLVPADPEVAEAFGIEPGADVYQRSRLVSDRSQPTHTLTSYYLPAHVADTPLADPSHAATGPVGGFAVLTLQGLEPDHMSETISTRMPTPEEVEALNLPVGEPVMVLARKAWTADNTLVEFTHGVYAGSRFAWNYEFALPD